MQHGFFPVSISKVLGTVFFYRSTPVAAFELYQKIILKKRKLVERLPLISLFHVQIQELTSRLSITQAFVFLAKFTGFYYHKIFETRY